MTPTNHNEVSCLNLKKGGARGGYTVHNQPLSDYIIRVDTDTVHH